MPKQSNNYEVPEDASPLPSGEIPHPVRPMVEHPGAFLPYRGFQYHGVTPGNVVTDDPHATLWDEGRVRVAEEAPPEREVVPVPVHIVNESAKESRDFFTDQTGIGPTPDSLVGKNHDRTSLMIKNLDTTNIIYIGTTQTGLTANGYPLEPGEEISLSTTAAVYAVSPNGPVSVAILGEVSHKL